MSQRSKTQTEEKQKRPSHHLVLDAADPVEDNGTVTTVDVVDRVRDAVHAQAGEHGELRQSRGRPAPRHLRHLHILEVHAGGDRESSS